MTKHAGIFTTAGVALSALMASSGLTAPAHAQTAAEVPTYQQVFNACSKADSRFGDTFKNCMEAQGYSTRGNSNTNTNVVQESRDRAEVSGNVRQEAANVRGAQVVDPALECIEVSDRAAETSGGSRFYGGGQVYGRSYSGAPLVVQNNYGYNGGFNGGYYGGGFYGGGGESRTLRDVLTGVFVAREVVGVVGDIDQRNRDRRNAERKENVANQVCRVSPPR